MARIRTIKPEFCTSEQLAECSPTARLLFACMWCFCDDAGRHVASVRRLKMEVFPGDPFGPEEIEALVAELVREKLLLEYTHEGEAYWQVTGWKHQKIDKPTYKYGPFTPDGKPAPLPEFDEQSPSIPRAIEEGSPPEGSLRESKGMESKGMEGSSHSTTSRRPAAPSSSKKSKKPSLEEVKSYARELGYRMNAEQFFDHYESNGWKQANGNAIKDWRAAVRQWERREGEFGKDDRPPPKPKRDPKLQTEMQKAAAIRSLTQRMRARGASDEEIQRERDRLRESFGAELQAAS